MQTIDQLNQHYGLTDQLTFSTDEQGMAMVNIDNALGKASLALQGGHITHFQATNEAPLIWMSEQAEYKEGKALRGGIPICWPWFGPHPNNPSLPAHGYVRTSLWTPVDSKTLDDGRTQLTLTLDTDVLPVPENDHVLKVTYTITIGRELTIELTTTNLGESDYSLSEALHSYFLVSDVRQIKINGLDHQTYIDKVDGDQSKKQQGPVTIDQEVDRIYLNSSNDIEIIDPIMNRKILINSDNSQSIIVWNPWIEKSQQMKDMPDDGYLTMLCVETANTADNSITLAPGTTHKMRAQYQCAAS